MLQVKIAGKHYELADTLRVVYSLKDITGAKSMQDALQSSTWINKSNFCTQHTKRRRQIPRCL